MKFSQQPLTDDGVFKKGEAVAVNRVSQHNVGADIFEFVSDAIKLVNAVRLLIDGHDERERGGQVFERWL